MTEFLEKELPGFPSSGLDLTTFGQRLRHLRRARGYTLAELGTRVGRAPSALSLLENGRREPKLSLIESLATALSVPAEELLRHQPPSRRAQLEIAVEEAQHDPLYADLGLPHLKVGARVPNDVLEHLVALYGELRRQHTRPTATPEEARVANAGLRDAMRERGNYFAQIEHAAAEALESVSYRGGALSQGALLAIVGHHGFSVRYAQDLPRSVRSVTDLRHRRIYLKQESMGMHTPRTILLQTLGHFVLGHARRVTSPTSCASGWRRTTTRRPCWSRNARPRGSCARPRRPGICLSRISGTCSRCRMRWRHTGSPTSLPTISI